MAATVRSGQLGGGCLLSFALGLHRDFTCSGRINEPQLPPPLRRSKNCRFTFATVIKIHGKTLSLARASEGPAIVEAPVEVFPT